MSDLPLAPPPEVSDQAPTASEGGPRSPGEPGIGGPRLPLAGLDQRVGAFLVDVICFGVGLLLVLLASTFLWGPLAPILDPDDSLIYAEGVFTFTYPALSLLAALAWGGLLTGLIGRTPGKAALKIKVVTAGDHSRTLGFWPGMARDARFVCLIFFVPFGPFWVLFVLPFGTVVLPIIIALWLADHLWLLRGDHRQTLHDTLTRSHVIVAPPTPRT